MSSQQRIDYGGYAVPRYEWHSTCKTCGSKDAPHIGKMWDGLKGKHVLYNLCKVCKEEDDKMVKMQ